MLVVQCWFASVRMNTSYTITSSLGQVQVSSKWNILSLVIFLPLWKFVYSSLWEFGLSYKSSWESQALDERNVYNGEWSLKMLATNTKDLQSWQNRFRLNDSDWFLVNVSKWNFSLLCSSLLEILCSTLYDSLRPVIIHMNHMETLTELCTILKVNLFCHNYDHCCHYCRLYVDLVN